MASAVFCGAAAVLLMDPVLLAAGACAAVAFLFRFPAWVALPAAAIALIRTSERHDPLTNTAQTFIKNTADAVRVFALVALPLQMAIAFLWSVVLGSPGPGAGAYLPTVVALLLVAIVDLDLGGLLCRTAAAAVRKTRGAVGRVTAAAAKGVANRAAAKHGG